jgi:replication factor A1
MAADETYELEFIAFDQKAQQLIGKPLQRLQSMYDKFDAPAEISNLVGQTYTFIIKMSAKRSIKTDEPSYEVVSIKEQFGKQANVPVFRKTNPLPAASYFQRTQINLPSPIQIEPKKVKLQNHNLLCFGLFFILVEHYLSITIFKLQIQRKNQQQGIIITDPSEVQYQQTIDNKVTEYPKNKYYSSSLLYTYMHLSFSVSYSY